MAEILLAKTAGFCFGVNRAVNTVEELLREGKTVSTLGPIIHNRQVVTDFEKRGVSAVASPGECPPGNLLVIRSHGVPNAVIAEAEERGLRVVDATCPFVAKIHKIVAEKSRSGAAVVIAGDARHAEVEGILGHCGGAAYVVSSEKDLVNLQNSGAISPNLPVCAVAQTTFNAELWEKIKKIIKKVYTNAEIFDTICNATANRQAEAASLAKKCDAMIVVGGAHSSNTAKLKEVCEEFCGVVRCVETAGELKNFKPPHTWKVGVVAGASTPVCIIKEVVATMCEQETQTEKNLDEMPFGEALEAYDANEEKPASTDRRVKGTVTAVSPTDIQVDIGTKYTGYISAAEYSSDPTVKLEECVHVGDVLDLIILRTNDQEGTAELSKKRVDALAAWDAVNEAFASGNLLEAKVNEIVKGGVVCLYKGIRVFIPASQATLTRAESTESLKGKDVEFKIIEIGRGKRVIGSIRIPLIEKRKEQQAKFWENVAVGDRFTGKVKSLTGYGAFVDLGGVDGMVHISELSWQRIKHPSEVVSVGDVIDVYVKAIDTENKKISLGYKKADENPWIIFQNSYEVGDVIKVKIVSMTAYGAFARIIPGVDGLIHISKIADRHIDKPQDELKIGQEVYAKIIGIDTEKKRISLSIRDVDENEIPYEEPVAAEQAAEETAPAEHSAPNEEVAAATAAPAEEPATEEAAAVEETESAEEPAVAEPTEPAAEAESEPEAESVEAPAAADEDVPATENSDSREPQE